MMDYEAKPRKAHHASENGLYKLHSSIQGAQAPRRLPRYHKGRVQGTRGIFRLEDFSRLDLILLTPDEITVPGYRGRESGME